MTYDAPYAYPDAKPPIDGGGSVTRDQQATLNELVEVLSAHPRGLRRWSVMRAIRASRAKRGRNIPQKFEDDVERTFRRNCCSDTETQPAAPGGALFYRPKETAGEVWAIVPATVARPTADASHPLPAEPA